MFSYVGIILPLFTFSFMNFEEEAIGIYLKDKTTCELFTLIFSVSVLGARKMLYGTGIVLFAVRLFA